jgi:hypothetical protein
MHDYYDTPFRGSAGDPKYIFVRESKDIDIPNIHFIEFNCQLGPVSYDFSSGIIGFCGKIYPYLEMTSSRYYIPEIKPEHEYYYNMSDLNRNHPDIIRGKSKLGSYARYVHRIGDIENWLKNGTVSSWGWTYTAATDQKLLEIFRKYRVAYFVIPLTHGHDKKATVTLYPLLKNYSFFKVFDVYTTFQKIEMFLTNELIRPDEINIVIPDKLKAQSKGFDKWSFRKMKEDKK